ncbi:hypothetical protein D3C79_742280 [compost metagenome]
MFARIVGEIQLIIETVTKIRCLAYQFEGVPPDTHPQETLHIHFLKAGEEQMPDGREQHCRSHDGQSDHKVSQVLQRKLPVG